MTADAAPGTGSDGAASMAAAPPASRRGLVLRDYGIVVALVAIVVALSLGTTTFLTTSNLVNVLDQCAVVGLLATGATVCILSGVFDLTASASLAVSAIVGTQVVRATNVPFGFLVAVLVGLGLGFVTGTIVVRSGVNSFIATLATSIIYRGLAVIITGASIIYPLDTQTDGYSFFTKTSILKLTWATVIFAVVVALIGVLVSTTTFGRRLYAVGGNMEAARLSGIRVGSIHVSAYMISGLCSALAGLILASRAGSAQSAMATGIELTAIAAAVIGGTSILGGEGAIWRGVVGALLIVLIGNGFNLLGWNTTYQQLVQGALILFAVTLDRLLRRGTR